MFAVSSFSDPWYSSSISQDRLAGTHLQHVIIDWYRRSGYDIITRMHVRTYGTHTYVGRNNPGISQSRLILVTPLSHKGKQSE
jgi:hypothetical protein